MVTLLGVGNAPSLGLTTGKRLVRWVGFRSYLDERDPQDPQGRTIRYLLSIGAYPRDRAQGHREFAALATKYMPVPGVTTRQIRWIDEAHNGTGRTYEWTTGNGFVAEMDERDAEKMLSHPVLGEEFAYADIPDARTRPRRPTKAVREQWKSERPFIVPRPR